MDHVHNSFECFAQLFWAYDHMLVQERIHQTSQWAGCQAVILLVFLITYDIVSVVHTGTVGSRTHVSSDQKLQLFWQSDKPDHSRIVLFFLQSWLQLLLERRPALVVILVIFDV